MTIYPRRAMLQFLGGILAYIHAEPVVSASSKQYANVQQMAPSRSVGLRLVLDGMDDVVVLYHGEMIRVTPAEIMASLRQPSLKEPHD